MQFCLDIFMFNDRRMLPWTVLLTLQKVSISFLYNLKRGPCSKTNDSRFPLFQHIIYTFAQWHKQIPLPKRNIFPQKSTIAPTQGIHWHGIFVIHETATEDSRGQHHTQDFKLIKEDPMHGGCKRRRIRGKKDASPRGNYQRKRAGSKNDAVVKEISANNKEDW